MDSFAQAFLGLVKANRALKKVEIGHLAQWCKEDALPADAAVTFAESSVTQFALHYVTLAPTDALFFTSLAAHSRTLTHLRFSGCKFDDRMAKALAAGLSQSSSLKELFINDFDPRMTDDGALCFADAIPGCGLETLRIQLDGADGIENEGYSSDLEFGMHPAEITTKGLAALSCALEKNTTLRVFEVSPIAPIAGLSEDMVEDSNDADFINAGANSALLRNIKKKELAINADPQKCVCALTHIYALLRNVYYK